MDTDRTSRSVRTAAAGTGFGPDGRTGRAGGAVTAALRVTGAGLLIAAAAIHLDLYLTGYRSIPTIGGLFLLQVIVGFLAGAVVLVTGSRLAAVVGAVFALATLGGYLLSVWTGLFGFKEVRTTAGIVAGLIEVAAFAALAVLAVRPRPSGQQGQPSRWRVLPAPVSAWLDKGAPGTAAAVGGVSVVALVLLGVAVAGAGGSAGPPSPGASAGTVLKTTTINGTTVLTNGKGFTLYSFGPDTAGRSVCNGACAQYWPPVTGPATAGSGVTGMLGTITRSDGSKQATYDGHPLYTYIADNAPGQANGNNLNLNGGIWHEVPVTS